MDRKHFTMLPVILFMADCSLTACSSHQPASHFYTTFNSRSRYQQLSLISIKDIVM
jgi:hypothetical protein